MDYTYSDHGGTNSLELIKEQLKTIMDETVASETLTGYMTPNPELFKATQRAGEFSVPTIVTNGLADYDRAKGYPAGGVTLSFETYKLTHDRARAMVLDAVDVMSDDGIMTASAVIAELIRAQAVPEIDATRISTLANMASVDGNTATDTPTKANFLSLIMSGIRSVRTGLRLMSNDGIHVHVNSDYIDLLEQSSEYTKSKNLSDGIRRLDSGVEYINGAEVIETPAEYMSTELTFNNNDDGGFTASGSEVACLVVAPNIANGIIATQVANIYPRGVAQDVDGSKIQYRLFHDCLVLKNKRAGLYAVIPTRNDDSTSKLPDAETAVRAPVDER